MFAVHLEITKLLHRRLSPHVTFPYHQAGYSGHIAHYLILPVPALYLLHNALTNDSPVRHILEAP